MKLMLVRKNENWKSWLGETKQFRSPAAMVDLASSISI